MSSNAFYTNHTYQHYDNVSICMVPELPKPSLHILVSQVLGNVVHQECAHSTTVIPGKFQYLVDNFIGMDQFTTSQQLRKLTLKLWPCNALVRQYPRFEL